MRGSTNRPSLGLGWRLDPGMAQSWTLLHVQVYDLQQNYIFRQELGRPSWLKIWGLNLWLNFGTVSQRRKKRTRPPPKENLLENFSGLKEELSRSVVDTNTLWKPGKPYLPPKSFLCGPHFFRQRKVLHWSRAVYAFFFPVSGTWTLNLGTGIPKGRPNHDQDHFWVHLAAPTSLKIVVVFWPSLNTKLDPVQGLGFRFQTFNDSRHSDLNQWWGLEVGSSIFLSPQKSKGVFATH